MIATRRGLAVVVAIAAVLAVVVAVDVLRAPGAVDRALIPGFDPDRVTELIWDRPGRPAIRVARSGSGWRVLAPSAAPADPDAIGEVFAALRGARWHRRGAAPAVHTTLTVVGPAQRRVIGLGEPIAGTEQSWIVDGDRGSVVDRWVARALDRDLLALRIRAPLVELGGASAITLARGGEAGVELALEPRPWRLVQPVTLVPAAELAGQLERALREIVIVRIPDGPVTGHGLAISVAGVRPVSLELGGSCPGAGDLVAVSGTTGDGCIAAAAGEAVDRVVRRLRAPAAEIVERRPIPFEPVRVVLADGTALDTAPLRVAGAAADPARVAELMFALTAPAEPVAVPGKPPIAHLVVTGRAGLAVTLDVFADRVVARHGEPIALRLAPGAWAVVVRPSRELREVAPWREEPTTVTELRIDGVRYHRGAVIGAWTRVPPGPADGNTVEALVGWLAAPRPHGFATPPASIVHRVVIAIEPPVGAPSEHMLELGAASAAGCAARVEHDAIALPASVCAQIAALAR